MFATQLLSTPALAGSLNRFAPSLLGRYGWRLSVMIGHAGPHVYLLQFRTCAQLLPCLFAILAGKFLPKLATDH
jgi:hypothetical protein